MNEIISIRPFRTQRAAMMASSALVPPNMLARHVERGPSGASRAALQVESTTEPLFESHGLFTMSEAGLFYSETRSRGDSATTERVRVSAPLAVIGRGRSSAGTEWGLFLRWRDHDGRSHEQFISNERLHGDAMPLCASLAAGGLWISRDHQKQFARYLAGVDSKARVTMVYQTGWHEIDGKLVFVLPSGTIGLQGDDRVVLADAAHGPYETRGTLDDWRMGIGTLTKGHAIPMLAVSAAFAGPLLYLASTEGGGINLFGQSSKGKTTALQAAASVWGRGTSPGYLRAWRATANGLEAAAAQSSDTLMALDELGLVEARDAASALYGLSNGTGKQRAARDGSPRTPKSWRVLFLSSGELPVEAKLAEGHGRKAMAGQLVRLIDVPADRGEGFGAFDNGGPDGDAGSLARAIKEAAVASYGTAGPEFVRRLLADGASGDDVRKLVAQFTATTIPQEADGQVTRAANRFGLIAAAGELAITFGVVPWPAGAARDAAAWALARWIELRGGTEPAEARQAIEAVKLFIEQHGSARFADAANVDARPVANRAGFIRSAGTDRDFCILPEVWRAEVCAGRDPVFVARTLADVGLLRRQAEGLQSVIRVSGIGPMRVYAIPAAILAGGDASDGANNAG